MQVQQNPSLRWLNLALGIWLVVSAVIWIHDSAQFVSTLAVGAACAVFAALALRMPPLRYVNVALAIWLFIGTWTLPSHSRVTLWSNTLVSIVMLAAAISPGKRGALYVHRV